MNKINQMILKYGLNKNNRNDIQTTCDLYFNLFTGYFIIIVCAGLLFLYLTGMYNFISLDKEFGAMLFYRTYEGQPDTYEEITMAIASVFHILAIFALAFYLLVQGLFYGVHGMIWLFSRPKMQSIFSSIELPKPWCRKLSEEEKQRIRQL